jgi:hypothetical protein
MAVDSINIQIHCAGGFIGIGETKPAVFIEIQQLFRDLLGDSKEQRERNKVFRYMAPIVKHKKYKGVKQKKHGILFGGKYYF